jgi:hypothetical protein
MWLLPAQATMETEASDDGHKEHAGGDTRLVRLGADQRQVYGPITMGEELNRFCSSGGQFGSFWAMLSKGRSGRAT